MSIELSILTLNIWGMPIPFISLDKDERINAIGDELSTGKYDIVCLQEVWTENYYQIIKNKSKEVLPYSHYFYSGVVGSGLCILSKWPIISAIFHAWRLNGYLHRIQHADWFGGKGCGLCKLNINGKIVNIYTAHLHAEYNRANDDYLTHRVVQAFDTSQFIESTRGNSILQILAGDLNTEPGDLTYRVMLTTSQLTDAFVETNTKFYGTHEAANNFYTPPNVLKDFPNGKRIDYILYRPAKKYEIKLLEFSHPLPDNIPNKKISYSDHEAILLRLQIKRSDPSNQLSTNVENSIQNDVLQSNKIQSNNVLALKESIDLCNKSIEQLETDKRTYFMLATTIIVILFCMIELQPITYGFKTLYLLLKIILSGLCIFFILMASLWNKCEHHSILSVKLSMEIALNGISQIQDTNTDNF